MSDEPRRVFVCHLPSGSVTFVAEGEADPVATLIADASRRLDAEREAEAKALAGCRYPAGAAHKKGARAASLPARVAACRVPGAAMSAPTFRPSIGAVRLKLTAGLTSSTPWRTLVEDLK
jgi:hypothetical protein